MDTTVTVLLAIALINLIVALFGFGDGMARLVAALIELVTALVELVTEIIAIYFGR